MRLLLLYLFIFLGTSASAQLYTFRNLNHRDGLNMAAINCINQSDDGYIWLGTDGGELVRFDGKEFQEVRDEDGDNNHHYENIYFHDNKVLFASRYKGFFQFDKNSNSITRIDVKQASIGEGKAYLAKDSIDYYIGSKGICSKAQDGKLMTLKLFLNKSLELLHIVESEDAFFIFTNQGQFKLSDNKLISLKDWLNVEVENLNEFNFGYYTDGKLTLFNSKANRWLEIILNSRGSFFSINESDSPFVFKKDERIKSYSFNQTSRSGAVLTNHGRVYQLKSKNLKVIAHNYNEPLLETNKILTDYNGDFWVCSDLRGVYKISLEAFTKMQLLPLYEFPDIGYSYKTIYGDIIISRMNGETFVRNLVDTNQERKFNFVVHGIEEINGDYYVGTTRGLKLYNPSTSPDFNSIYFDNQNITMVVSDKSNLWVGVAGKGLFRINTNTKEVKQIESSKVQVPQYFYTAQVSNNQKNIIFGTNSGLFIFNKENHTIERLKVGPDLGSYSGVSTKDVYGNRWFTLEKGIIGITTKNKLRVIHGEKYMQTNLFYTLNSDNYGNIIVGTNKGITIINLTKNGDIQDYRQFDGNSGFKGYETHMRSQFQSEEGIFLGTVEGLFLVNTRIIENLKAPLAPVVTDIDDHVISKEGRNNFSFQFHVNNPKAGNIIYSYRLGKGDWDTFENEETAHFYGLSNGKYKLEVRSSFDGIHFSESTFYDFEVSLPLWRTNWFIIVIIVIIVGINILLLRYNKSFDTNTLLDTKDTTVHLRMTPALLLFGTIAVTGSHILAPILNPELELHLAISLIVGFVLLGLFFMSLSAKKNNAKHLFNTYLLIALCLITLHFFYEVYESNLHPFHIIGLILTSMMVPYIITKIKSTIVFSLMLLTMAIVCMVLVNEPVYSKTYFLIAIIVMVSLLIFASFLRYDSLEKLMFISGIINKGNIPAIAFNNKGIMTYVSENISHFIGVNYEEIINQDISILNNYVAFDDKYREVDVLQQFNDGKSYLVPMADNEGVVRWIEWSFKEFSKNVKVMLGQDVSEKMELENTYELLVQNAEDFIYRCDINGNFVFLNDVCYSKMGYTEEELIGKPSLTVIAPSHHEEISEYYHEHFLNRKISSYKEFPVTRKDGSILWVGQYVTTLFAAGSDSFINGFIALARDITEDRQKRQLIREQRDNITASINYAQRIQVNLLPHERLFNSYFKDHFIIYKPKDIVSGDFYWMEKIGTKTILALGDCTGHGVPGSFMTLLGINLLNSIIHEEQISDPGKILNELDKRLMEILPRGHGENRVNDGMEITVCVIDETSKEMGYACAGSRFLIHRDEEYTMFKGDNKHIGDNKENGFTDYQTSYTELYATDQLYLFTDGFQDQFGGPNDKKYSFRRMLELFEVNLGKPLCDQQVAIEEEFDLWIGHGEQTDDLSVISFIRNLI